MKKRLTLTHKLLYSFGTFGFSMIDRIMVTWLMYYWVSTESANDPLLTGKTFGIIMVLGRVVDAIADPLVAQWSDNSNSQRGRRMPFLFFGGVTYIICFVLLFYPPVNGISSWNAVYLTLILGGYFFLFTVYVTPYLALLPELANTNKDRIDLATYKAIFSLIGVAIAMVGSGILIGLLGFKGMIVSLAILGVITMYLPLKIKEKDYCDAQPATMKLVESVVTTLKNRAFLIYLVGNVTFWFGFNIVTLAVPFYVTVLVGAQEEATTFFLAATFGVAALFFPIIKSFSHKYGLKSMMALSMGLFALLLPLIYFIPQPLFGLSSYLYGMILLGLIGIPIAGLFIVPDAIVAAVTDFEEIQTGQRREAMYFGTQGLILKVVMGLSSLLTGILMDTFGQSIDSPLGIQLTGPIAAIFIVIGLIVFWRYPEKEVRELEKKKMVTPTL